MTSGHASNNPFQVVYFCFPIKFTIYPYLKPVLFSQLNETFKFGYSVIAVFVWTEHSNLYFLFKPSPV